MEKITTIGLDIAKHVFQVHGINGAGATVSRRKLLRDDVVGFLKALPPCLIESRHARLDTTTKRSARWIAKFMLGIARTN
ncbi:hypothetical protein IE4803_PB00157 (plasmid) [Rhizobium etli bv. phaseoli str. IE4803]|nr:hypothetical protein IE4803_PB00157 [Rhizobium etli bv. phaseoli str. IE4803]